MSRDETRHCDRCGKALQKDAGAWLGYTFQMEGCFAGESGGLHWEERMVDLCPDCARKFRQMEW